VNPSHSKISRQIESNFVFRKELEEVCFKFQIPCKNHQNKRVQCASLSLDDIVEFRKRYLNIPDRYTQDQFISKCLKIRLPERRRPRVLTADANKPRNFNVDYTLETIDGVKLGVCKPMFIEALGIKRKRLTAISQQLYEMFQNDPEFQEKPVNYLIFYPIVHSI
jgi:hypothetical protein